MIENYFNDKINLVETKWEEKVLFNNRTKQIRKWKDEEIIDERKNEK